MSKAIVRFLAILGALWLMGMVIVLAAVIGVKGRVPSKTILEANFEQTFPEDVPDTPSAQLLLTERQTLRDAVDALDRGANDDRVVGMIAKIGAAPMGMAQTQELRDAVQRFRAHKKFAVAYAETFGEFGPGNGAYYLATAFDHIYLQPSGDVGLTGIIMESPFVKGTLSKLGVTFHGDHRYEYKNALNFYTETKYTGPHKEAMTALMTSWFNQIKEGICQARQIAPDKFQALVDAGPYLGKEAVDAKLVDAVLYRDNVYDKVKSQVGGGAELLYLDKCLYRAGRPHDHGNGVRRRRRHPWQERLRSRAGQPEYGLGYGGRRDSSGGGRQQRKGDLISCG
jgi:protease-4